MPNPIRSGKVKNSRRIDFACLVERKHIISHRGEVKQATAEAMGRV
jgi:hypothetical protein